MRMGVSFYATLAFIVICSVSCTNLFTSPIGRSKKARLHADILSKVADGTDPGPDSSHDGALATVVSNAPVLAAQSLTTVLIYANSIAQLFSLLPPQYETQAIRQSLGITAMVKLVDAFNEIDIAPFSERDDMFANDLLERATAEMRALVNGKASATLAYAFLCMSATSQAQGCLLPVLVGEMPSLLRTAYILLEATTPQGARLARDVGLRQLLFPAEAGHFNVTHNATTATNATTRFDEVCDTTSSALEVYVVARMMFSLLSFRSGVRSAKDVATVIVQVLLLQNYLSLRTQSFLSGKSGDLSSFRSSTLGTQVAETVRSAREQLVAVMHQIRTGVSDPAARSALLKNALRQWGLVSGRKVKPKRIHSPRRARRASTAKTLRASEKATDHSAEPQRRPRTETTTKGATSDSSS